MESILAWLTANMVFVGPVVIAILDLIFGMNPSWESNGIVHFFVLQIRNFFKPKA